MPIIQPPPAPPKKVTIGVRFEEEKLAALKRYGTFLGTRNFSHIISESLDRVYKIDTDYKAWLKAHPNFVLQTNRKRNNGAKQHSPAVVPGAPAPSLVDAAQAADHAEA